MTDLTSRQRAHLRTLAHHLKPVVQVGTSGVTDQLIGSVVEALRTRELIKVKVHESAPVGVRPTAEAIVAALPAAALVQTIGRTAVIYRPDPDEPEIRLP